MSVLYWVVSVLVERRRTDRKEQSCIKVKIGFKVTFHIEAIYAVKREGLIQDYCLD